MRQRGGRRGGRKGEAGGQEGAGLEGLLVQKQGDLASYEAPRRGWHQALARMQAGPWGGVGVGWGRRPSG